MMGTRPDIAEPWQMVSLDFIGPLPRSNKGFKYLLVITDYFSKYVLLVPLRSATACSLCLVVEEQLFLVYGVPQTLICDNGVQMTSKSFKELCARYKVKILYTPLYYPRADPTERTNQTIETMISCYIRDNHRTWADNLAAVGYAIRTAKSEVTGHSPYYINFGREHRISGDEYDHPMRSHDSPMNLEQRKSGFAALFEDVRRRLLAAQEKYRDRYNLRRRPVQFRVGDLVLRKNKALSSAPDAFCSKLAPRYIGPFIIAKKSGSFTYELKDDLGRHKGVWHVQDLKPVFNPGDGGA